jgi:hypothetical protein
MQITLTEEEYNKLKKDEKQIYDNAYQDAYDAIWEREKAYIKDLTDLFKNHFSYYLSHDEHLAMKIRDLQEKHKIK